MTGHLRVFIQGPRRTRDTGHHSQARGGGSHLGRVIVHLLAQGSVYISHDVTNAGVLRNCVGYAAVGGARAAVLDLGGQIQGETGPPPLTAFLTFISRQR